MDPSIGIRYCPMCSREYSQETVCVDDGTLLIIKSPQQDPVLGQLLKGTYQVEEKIGEGGMGSVYRATQQPLGRSVAVKTILSTHQSSPDLVKRFFREAKMLSQFNHPNIVGIIDFGHTETGFIYMVMEYLTGNTLDKIVPPSMGLSFQTIVNLMEQICAGVGAAHLNNMVHRDLKPSNIFLAKISGADDVVKILDFGIAKAAEEKTQLTQNGMVVGSPGYISPEQITASSEPDARSDIYALGAILYFMIAGQPAYRGNSTQSILTKQLIEPPEAINFDQINKPEAAVLMPIILKAMHQEPSQRYQTTVEFMDALYNVCGISDRANKTKPLSPLIQTGVINSPATAAIATEKAASAPGSKRKIALVSASVALVLVSTVLLLLHLQGLAPWTTARAKPSNRASLARGVSETEIVLGMSAPFSGPAKELGRAMKLGIDTCFRQINDNGGINGRKLTLVALDDGYEPDRALENMKDLLENKRVFAIIGNVGTPTAEATLPYALQKNTLFFGALTGANLLRKDPPDRYVFNYRASYAQETAAIVNYLIEIKKLKPEQIAVFAQEDGYGEAGFSGVAKTLRKYGREPGQILKVGYQRNTTNVDNAVQEIIRNKDQVRAVIMVATYRPAAIFIQKLKDQKLDLIFAGISFIGSQSLAEELLERGSGYATGVIVTQVVPHYESKSTGVLKYRESLSRYFPNEQPGFVSLEGYISANILTEGIRRAGIELNTETLVSTLESIQGLDLGIGAPINFNPSEHQGAYKVWGTILDESAKYQILELD
ncbi:MAG: ABC transporter substrate-binding protein [Acidobacteriota bacterium]